MADIIPTVLDGIQHIETCWAMPPSLPYAVITVNPVTIPLFKKYLAKGIVRKTSR